MLLRPGSHTGRVSQNEKRQPIYWYDKRPGMLGGGFFAAVFTHVGQWGTHVDPPAHFQKGGRTVDQIMLKGGAQISLRKAQSDGDRPRNHRYRSRSSHEQGRLYTRDLSAKPRPLSD